MKLRLISRLGLAAFSAIAIATAASAATVNTIANTIFVVDESGSMAGEQAWLRTTVVDALDAGLLAEGVTSRSYGVVGYGSGNSHSGVGSDPHVHTAGGGAAADLMDATDTKSAMTQFVTSGFTEDGWKAIAYALNFFNFDAGAAINIVLVTDEDRDNTSSDTFASVLALLNSKNAILNVVVNNPFGCDGGSALGRSSSEGFQADGNGGYATCSNPTTGNGEGATETQYVPLALQTGGAAWNLNVLRSGGNNALSFTEAFVDIKVQEITTRPIDPIPLPAPAFLLIVGLSGLAAIRRKSA